ncbi:hypothetical protein MTO96_005038 [Rhipicephalus appendiculatus]
MDATVVAALRVLYSPPPRHSILLPSGENAAATNYRAVKRTGRRSGLARAVWDVCRDWLRETTQRDGASVKPGSINLLYNLERGADKPRPSETPTL